MSATRLPAVLALLTACTTIDEPRSREEVTSARERDAGATADADSDADADADSSPCTRSADWRVRGLPASFFAGKGEGVGVWGVGDAFAAPDAPSERVRIDAYVAGHVDELRDRLVPLGTGHNAARATFTHWIVMRLGCDETGSCAPGTYLATSGRARITRLEASNGSSFEMHAESVVLRRGRELPNGTLDFTEGPDACVYFRRLVLGAVMFAPSETCATRAYPECAIAEDAHERHP